MAASGRQQPAGAVTAEGSGALGVSTPYSGWRCRRGGDQGGETLDQFERHKHAGRSGEKALREHNAKAAIP